MALGMVKDFPNYSVGYLHAGMAYHRAGMKEKAIEMLSKGIELNLDDPRAYYIMGLCLDDPDDSKLYYEVCSRRYPQFAYCVTALGRVHLFQHRYDEALTYFEKSIQLSPDWKAYAYLIQLHALNKDNEKVDEVMRHGMKTLNEKGKTVS